MAASFGITLISAGPIIESLDVESKVDTKVLLNSDGTYSEGRAMNPTFSFSVKGKGTTNVTVGGSTGAPSGVSGKVVITSVKTTQSNEDWVGYEYSGTAYPNAT
jgi:hypothetical protein